jgi:hypothetical protein
MTAKRLPAIAPCPKPWCKGKRHLRYSTMMSHDVWVRCSCGWCGPARATERGAIDAWNKRAIKWVLTIAQWFAHRYKGRDELGKILKERILNAGAVLPAKAGKKGGGK